MCWETCHHYFYSFYSTCVLPLFKESFLQLSKNLFPFCFQFNVSLIMSRCNPNIKTWSGMCLESFILSHRCFMISLSIVNWIYLFFISTIWNLSNLNTNHTSNSISLSLNCITLWLLPMQYLTILPMYRSNFGTSTIWKNGQCDYIDNSQSRFDVHSLLNFFNALSCWILYIDYCYW